MKRNTGNIAAAVALALAGSCSVAQAQTNSPLEQAPIPEHETEASGRAAYCISREPQPGVYTSIDISQQGVSGYTSINVFISTAFLDRDGIESIQLRAYPGEQLIAGIDENDVGRFSYYNERGYFIRGRFTFRWSDLQVEGPVESLGISVLDKDGNRRDFNVRRIDCRTLEDIELNQRTQDAVLDVVLDLWLLRILY